MLESICFFAAQKQTAASLNDTAAVHKPILNYFPGSNKPSLSSHRMILSSFKVSCKRITR